MRLVVEADGGSRGNPGPAGYGALVRDAESESVLARRNGFLGTATNNVAEYSGLIAGLRAAAGIDPVAAVEVRMDSKLVVEQMSGRWQVKSADLRPLAREAAVLAAGFAQVRYTWIPRARNGEADALANAAMDARGSTFDPLDDALVEQSTPPPAGTAQAAPGPAPWRDAPAGPPTRLVLLRHGQTALSIERRFSGSGDPPLTDLGRRQAIAAAETLGAAGSFDAIVTSPLARARATADAAGEVLGLTPQVDEAWRECDFGAFEGMTFAQVRKRYPTELDAWLADPSVPPPGGESFEEVTGRVRAARDILVAAVPAGQRLLLVSHVTPIKVVGRLAIDAPPSALRAMHLDLASISRVDVHVDGLQVLVGWNDTAHLAGLQTAGL
jgi:probable phosphoglycerate mutase